jgi:carboxyl-terminal processing protease
VLEEWPPIENLEVNLTDSRLSLVTRLLICLGLAYVAGLGVYGVRAKLLDNPSVSPQEAQIFWEAWNRLGEHFYGPLPTIEDLTHSAIRSSLELLDPWTLFIRPTPRELERDELRGAYGGIGVTVSHEGEGSMALYPFPGSPAERAGVQRSDIVLAVDGEPISAGRQESDVAAQLRGEVGTQVTLAISRPHSSSLVLAITREKIVQPSVTWREVKAGIGYIGIARFTERTDTEITTALEALRPASNRGLVLDLRGNSGGLVDEAVAVAGRFLKEDDIVLYQRDRTGERALRTRGKTTTDIPLVVLVDAQTASAAEMVAGALQDHKRAVLIGDGTFGKGSVQEIHGLSDGSAVHITAAIWLTPKRRRIDGHGLTPDIAIRQSDVPGDEQLKLAVAHLELES